jgi:L-serine deaminase
MATEYAKVSVTLPAALLDRVRQRVGARGLSGYVAHALEEEERREALQDWLTSQDAEFGPVPDDVMAEARAAWQGNAAGQR